MKIIEKAEDRIQAEAYIWFHNTFPEFRGLLCYNLNNSANKIQGNKNKSMGLQAGRSDMVMYFKGNAYMFEFKTAEGRQQKVQKEWMVKVLSQGFEYHIIRNTTTFKETICNILS